MHAFYSEFISYLDREEKEKCLQFILSKLERDEIDVVTLYNEVLTPSLYAEFCNIEQKEMCIWAEHVRTSIIRTIIECCYPYIIKEKTVNYGSASKGKVVVVCPPGELHEIGARMVSDFFSLCGFSVIFVGANTPQDDIITAIKYINPQFVAISITNYFNLVAARTMVSQITKLKNSLPFKIILGGQACRRNPDACQLMNADLILDSFADIQKLTGGQTDVTS